MTRSASFWDRRRAAVQAEAEADGAAEQAALEAEQQQAFCDKSDEDILSELGLPDPETLIKGDDFAAFMAKAVPEHIRRRALRNLWRSNPVLACVDGLNDYDDDYLAGSFGNAPVKTSYKVGKGLLAHVLEVARHDETTADDVLSLDKDENLGEDDAIADFGTGEVIAEPDTATEHTPAQQEPELGKARRMVFHFDGNSA